MVKTASLFSQLLQQVPKNRDCPKRSEVRAETGLSLLLGFSPNRLYQLYEHLSLCLCAQSDFFTGSTDPSALVSRSAWVKVKKLSLSPNTLLARGFRWSRAGNLDMLLSRPC